MNTKHVEEPAQEDLSAAVLIIGAGPVGLTLAAELAGRGVRVLVVESRRPAEAPNVRCNHVASRSMEIFRRIGVAGALRNAGLPPDYPNDVSYRTAATGREITRIRIPCRRDRFDDRSGPDGWWPTPEPPHRINQVFLEPILFAHVSAMPGVQVLNRCEFESAEQGAGKVVARVRSLDSGHRLNIAADYMVGCDGGKSQVRRIIGAEFTGDAVVQRVQSTWIEADGLIDQMSVPPAWAMFSLNPRRSGNIYSIDGKKSWLVHNYLRDDEADFDSVDRDWAIRQILGVDESFEYRVISREDWFGRRLIANRFRQGRMFIAGDAAHIWVPYGGYGMNAGIADASNLAWGLAARINGWGGEHILDAYEAERLAITDQVSRFAMDHSAKMASRRRGVPDNIEDDDDAGEQTRATFGQDVYELNVQQYCCAGLNYGYFYDKSPIVVADDEQPPPYTMGSYTESTVPGCRLPHCWMPDGASLYDRLGPGYSLVVTAKDIDVSPLRQAAERINMPLAVIECSGVEHNGRLDRALLLVRTDQHIAWRGHQLPDDPDALVRQLSGHAKEHDSTADSGSAQTN